MLIGSSFPHFKDSDGKALDGGSIWFGVANQNPETNPISIFWDEALTQPASQPVKTLAGYIVRDGNIANLYAASTYSITVKNKSGVLLYSLGDSSKFDVSYLATSLRSDLQASSGSSIVGFKRIEATSVARDVQSKLQELPSPEDFGAIGDGVADDTAALQKLFNACSAVEFTPGKIYSSAKLTVSNDLTIVGYGSKLLHKTNSASNSNGLLEIKVDKKVKIYGLEIDGNIANQIAAYLTYNLIWCSIGSIELHECYIHDSKGHLIRTGNIDDFNSAYFAHDVVIENCRIVNPITTNSCGDNIRIERTKGALISNNFVYGGLSSIRTQLYCKDLKFYNNDSGYAWGDVGITVAQSENLEIIGNYCHHNYRHGYEIDGVVNCTNMCNVAYRNGFSGFLIAESGAAIYANDPRYWGSIAEGYGTNYSNQTYASPQVPNINTVHMHNVSIENGQQDRLIGLDTDIYANNYLSKNNQSIAGGSNSGQLSIEGGSGLKTGSKILNNVFNPNSTDAQAIFYGNYQFDSTVSGNRVIGNIKLMSLGAKGMWDANRANRFLQDSSKRSVLLTDANDAASITGCAVTHTTTTNPSSYPFTGVFAGGGGEKFLRFVARAAAPVTVQVAVNLYLDNTFVVTLVSLTNWNLTASYTEFTCRIPASASIGNNIRPQITLPNGNTIYIQEMNVLLPVSE